MTTARWSDGAVVVYDAHSRRLRWTIGDQDCGAAVSLLPPVDGGAGAGDAAMAPLPRALRLCGDGACERKAGAATSDADVWLFVGGPSDHLHQYSV